MGVLSYAGAPLAFISLAFIDRMMTNDVNAAVNDDNGNNMDIDKPVVVNDVSNDANALTLADIKAHIKLIERTVSAKEGRFLSRVLRTIPALRKRLNSVVLHASLSSHYSSAHTHRKESILSFVELGDVDTETVVSASTTTTTTDASLNTTAPGDSGNSLHKSPPDVELYLQLLTVIFLIDTKQYVKALECSKMMIKIASTSATSPQDALAAKLYFYHARTHELNGRLADIRGALLNALRTATLAHQEESQATLINTLLRNYLRHHLYDQADRLVSKSTFPEKASNGEWARHLYYLGRIRAIQLDYSESHRNLLQAIRKAPTSETASGFLQTAQKLAVIVQLLLGEIPDRSIFRQRVLRRALMPYLQLTQTVRVGDLNMFAEVIERYSSVFRADENYTLILRLRHNVIKTGVRMINLSYSRISLTDVCQKLHLESAEDAEFIVAKAIRDGVIDAVVDHECGFVQSKENVDIYSTNEPQSAYHQRILFCLNTYNDSVKAMRYPPNAHRKSLETPEERREREQTEKELAQEMQEDDEF